MKFYSWRQRDGLRRLFLSPLLLFAWPILLATRAVLRLFDTNKPKRILVIQLAGLGDTLMLTPAFGALQAAYPAAKIDFITLHGYVRESFEGHPRLNAVSNLRAYPGQWIIPKFSRRSGVRLVFAVIRFYPTLLLKHAFIRYDVGINFALSDFDRNLGNALLYCLGVRVRVGAIGSSDSSDKLLTNAVQVNYEQPRTEAYLQFLKPLGVAPEKTNYEFPVLQGDVETMKLALRGANVDTYRPIAVIHPGGKMHVNSRRWPAEYFASICEFLATSEGFEVVLTGDDDDADVCDQIARGLDSKVKSLAGQLTFKETAALLSLSNLCITNDTSTLHLAEATKVPRVISIFGPTDADILAPKNSRNIVMRSKLPCAPCMGGIIDGNTELCWRDIKEECLWGITPDQVIDVLRQLYQTTPVRVATA